MKTIAIAIACMLFVAVAIAFPVHNYPGLAELIDRSTHIALIRINAHVAGDGQTYDTYNVTFLEVFKGDILINTTQDIALAHIQMPGSFGSTESGFQPKQKYLVFLEVNTFTNIMGTHRNKPIIGSCWKLRDDVNLEMDSSQTTHDRLESLFDAQGWEMKAVTEQGRSG